VRIAVVSDIHGNLTAFEAVLADLKLTAPDLIFHGGDLADGGSAPLEIVDRIRDLGWPGVAGNTDEMLFDPASLQAFAAQSPALAGIFAKIEEMAGWTRDRLRSARLAWLRSLPRCHVHDSVALVHASPETAWRAPAPDASDEELRRTYEPLSRPIAVYGHIHYPYVRTLGNLLVANSGSAGMPYDGDRRAAYLLIDGGSAQIRRVDYEVNREIAALRATAIPHADWVARILHTAHPQMP
jgi:predicted phosphodiesterase